MVCQSLGRAPGSHGGEDQQEAVSHQSKLPLHSFLGIRSTQFKQKIPEHSQVLTLLQILSEVRKQVSSFLAGGSKHFILTYQSGLHPSQGELNSLFAYMSEGLIMALKF